MDGICSKGTAKTAPAVVESTDVRGEIGAHSTLTQGLRAVSVGPRRHCTQVESRPMLDIDTPEITPYDRGEQFLKDVKASVRVGWRAASEEISRLSTEYQFPSVSTLRRPEVLGLGAGLVACCVAGAYLSQQSSRAGSAQPATSGKPNDNNSPTNKSRKAARNAPHTSAVVTAQPNKGPGPEVIKDGPSHTTTKLNLDGTEATFIETNGAADAYLNAIINRHIAASESRRNQLIGMLDECLHQDGHHNKDSSQTYNLVLDELTHGADPRWKSVQKQITLEHPAGEVARAFNSIFQPGISEYDVLKGRILSGSYTINDFHTLRQKAFPTHMDITKIASNALSEMFREANVDKVQPETVATLKYPITKQSIDPSGAHVLGTAFVERRATLLEMAMRWGSGNYANPNRVIEGVPAHINQLYSLGCAAPGVPLSMDMKRVPIKEMLKQRVHAKIAELHSPTSILYRHAFVEGRIKKASINLLPRWLAKAK